MGDGHRARERAIILPERKAASTHHLSGASAEGEVPASAGAEPRRIFQRSLVGIAVYQAGKSRQKAHRRHEVTAQDPRAYVLAGCRPPRRGTLRPPSLSDAPDTHNAHRDGKRARCRRQLPPYSGTRVTGHLSDGGGRGQARRGASSFPSLCDATGTHALAVMGSMHDEARGLVIRGAERSPRSSRLQGNASRMPHPAQRPPAERRNQLRRRA